LEQAKSAIDLQIAQQQAAKQKIYEYKNMELDRNDPLNNYIISNFEAIAGLYDYYISVLNNNKNSMEGQITSLEQQKEDRSEILSKLILQNEMTNYQLVWTAENLMANYNNINYNIDELNSKLSLLGRQLAVAEYKKSIDMGTEMDVQSIELQIMDLESSLKQLNEQKDDIAGELNLMLGQDYDTDVTISDTPEPDYISIDSIDMEEDLKDALASNYKIILQSYEYSDKGEALGDAGTGNEETAAYNNFENEAIKLDDVKMKFEKDFHNAFQEVVDKKEALENEKFKLEYEAKRLNISELKYELGMISSISLDSARSEYKSQSIKVSTAEDELWKAYRKYEWMMKGLSL
jgi:hypothetical protein